MATLEGGTKKPADTTSSWLHPANYSPRDLSFRGTWQFVASLQLMVRTEITAHILRDSLFEGIRGVALGCAQEVTGVVRVNTPPHATLAAELGSNYGF